jgi:alpha-soluble NSF attachment protein
LFNDRLANKCLLKIAQIAADLEKYDVAIEKYEQVASAAIDDPLLKWSLKEYCFKAGLCHLCTGVNDHDIDLQV